MAKRFTDTDKWKKPFIRTLKTPYKLLWLYILDECDHAGVWQVDFDVARIKTGEKLDKEVALKNLRSKVVPFDGGEKWFIPDFIEFQYGELNPENRAHNSVLQIINKYELSQFLEKNKPLISPLLGATDMDMDKDKDKDKPAKKIFIPPTVDEVIKYFYENGYTEEAAKKAFDYYNTGDWKDAKGQKVVNWKQKMISVWFKDQYKSKQSGTVAYLEQRKKDQERLQSKLA